MKQAKMKHLSHFKEELTEVWDEFILQGRIKNDKGARKQLRAEILHSWYRCLDYKVNPLAEANTNILNLAEFNRKLEKNSELLDICLPTMQGIYKFVAGSGFSVKIADREGYVLKIIGDPEAVARIRLANFREGVKWDERSGGTTAIGLVLAIDKPIQVRAAEHYCRNSHALTCSAAPIHDPNTGEIIGALSMTGTVDKVHPHTLGIVVAAVDSIEKQMALCRSLQTAQMSRARRSSQQMVGAGARVHFDDLIGKEAQFKEAVELGKTAAETDCNVLLLGESGAGKDMLAQAIHNASSHRTQPFVALNCAAIPRELLASELFGYVEGAFTGAKKGGNAGKFELADGGTLFLDEIGEMPLDMQTSLLRVLEEKAVVRVGGWEVTPVDVRIIAATNKDLKLEMSRGNFRQDLYYRLNVMAMYLPPLRERKVDIPILAASLMRSISSRLGKRVEIIQPEVLEIFLNYDWPGNIRELQNVIERSAYLAADNSITLQSLPPEMRSLGPKPVEQRDTRLALESMEEATILSYMTKFQGNLTQVASKLGISRSTLYRKLKKYKISDFSGK
ncbi:MAG: sigma-54-dependent Fis family transcriptional regulator [Thermincola sp.]|jgi:transcriptional regulator of acetoin/glycerol metabolism|nr:sigma-54-dependent Fis family transcriptional regulator [Thermincola sp.]MDT3704235.1 sigma-54-dependent Fis family transcriptional regulator [Thermincola sp.]